jgi:hypothetical protein
MPGSGDSGDSTSSRVHHRDGIGERREGLRKVGSWGGSTKLVAIHWLSKAFAGGRDQPESLANKRARRDSNPNLLIRSDPDGRSMRAIRVTGARSLGLDASYAPFAPRMTWSVAYKSPTPLSPCVRWLRRPVGSGARESSRNPPQRRPLQVLRSTGVRRPT